MVEYERTHGKKAFAAKKLIFT